MDRKEIKKSIDILLDEKINKLGKNQKVAIVAGAVALPLALFYFLLYSPKHKEITDLEANKASLEQEIGQLEAKARKLEEHKAEMAEIEQSFRIASQLIPEQKEIPSLLTSISGLATNSGLEIITFTPQKEVPKDFYAEIPVVMQVKGTYHNFGHFLDQVGHLPRIATISNISMTSPTRVAGQMQLNIDFNLTAYRTISPQEAKANEKKK
ncbi:MAG: type 4a pilus biogenesis protein PilO [Desulfobacteraceae bacterium]|nr:type 4a pilus biogenesis protein PilO [Desulfobacteraceae bacterium]